ncbi:MAG: hypothetical protein MI810_16250 [Flavobacteriales bacterium]|nr:hypothetical protein [Flavobacteriales bacterium]
MKNRKMNLDRPRVDSKEIQARMDFNEVLTNFNAMSKPFYKSNWFLGTTGLASLGLIIGGTIAFQDPANEQADLSVLNTDAPPDLHVPDNSIISMNPELNDTSDELAKKTLTFTEYQHTNSSQNNSTIYEENSTLKVNYEEEQGPQEESVSTSPVTEDGVVEIAEEVVEEKTEANTGIANLSPRISGKINGGITREELFDNKGITTEGDVKVIHFELHLIDGLGGKVFEEESNQLNEDMKTALDRVLVGETIYFENIHGEAKSGEVVRLNPLRYILLN